MTRQRDDDGDGVGGRAAANAVGGEVERSR